MTQPVPGVPDPLMPFTSRFPLSPSGGRITPSSALPSGPATRPFGLRYAVRPVECGEHSKKPTNKTKTETTQISDDSKEPRTVPDVIHHVEEDEGRRGRGVSTPTVLVIAQAKDGTADLVVEALLARGAEVARIDTADFPRTLSLAATPDRIDSPGYLSADGRSIDLASVRSVYRRSPARFEFPDGMSAPEERFATLESSTG